MAERPGFQEKQFAFAAHIRDPENVAAPEGIEDRRMAIYRQLFFNNLANLLGNMFPVLKKLHSRDRWHALIRAFMRRHRAHTPYFLQLPAEFLDFLQNGYELDPADFPFLVELAHYEYIELALSISTATDDVSGVDSGGDLLDGTPVKSCLAWVYAYSYPVHRISADYLPTEPGAEPVVLCVYRRPNDEVGFLELNPVTARLLEAIDQNAQGHSGRTLLRMLAANLGYSDAEAFVEHGLAALTELRRLDILIGTKNPKNNGARK